MKLSDLLNKLIVRMRLVYATALSWNYSSRVGFVYPNINLNRDHVNTKRREFMVRGKAKRTAPYLSVSLLQSMSTITLRHASTTSPLFLSYSRNNISSTTGDYRRLSARSVQRMMLKIRTTCWYYKACKSPYDASQLCD